jgi:hypothetical protein
MKHISVGCGENLTNSLKKFNILTRFLVDFYVTNIRLLWKCPFRLQRYSFIPTLFFRSLWWRYNQVLLYIRFKINVSCQTCTCGCFISIRYLTQQVGSSDNARIVPYIKPHHFHSITKRHSLLALWVHMESSLHFNKEYSYYGRIKSFKNLNINFYHKSLNRILSGRKSLPSRVTYLVPQTGHNCCLQSLNEPTLRVAEESKDKHEHTLTAQHTHAPISIGCLFTT